jgi:hypothetical protein
MISLEIDIFHNDDSLKNNFLSNRCIYISDGHDPNSTSFVIERKEILFLNRFISPDQSFKFVISYRSAGVARLRVSDKCPSVHVVTSVNFKWQKYNRIKIKIEIVHLI